MDKLPNSLLQDIDQASYEIARQARQYFDDWKSGKVYIPMPALRAMGRRYLHLRDVQNLLPLEVYEFGRLYAFFCLVYPDGELPSLAVIAIDFSNLIIERSTPPPLVEVS